jgi:hypothetical protein
MVHLAIIVHLALHPVAAFEYRESAPASLFPSGSAAQDYSLPESVSNPAYLPLVGTSFFSASGTRPYSLEGMGASTIRLGICGAGAGAAARWSMFGIDGYTEHIVELAGGYRPMRFISLGIGVSWYGLAISCDGVSKHTGVWE